MRRLTFEGFLQSYVRALAGEDTLALPHLVELVEVSPRLAEPLLLWAVTTDRGARLERLLEDGSRLCRELRSLRHAHAKGELLTALNAGDPDLRPEYLKVWHSFVVRRDAHERDKELRLKARDRVLALERHKRVTRYRMAKDLGLNPGNLHAYLSQGNPTKLSLDKVSELIEYLEAA